MPIITTFYGILIPICYKDEQKDLLSDRELAVHGLTLFSFLPYKNLKIAGFSISAINVVIVEQQT